MTVRKKQFTKMVFAQTKDNLTAQTCHKRDIGKTPLFTSPWSFHKYNLPIGSAFAFAKIRKNICELAGIGFMTREQKSVEVSSCFAHHFIQKNSIVLRC